MTSATIDACLLENAEPLRPNGCARMLLFWMPFAILIIVAFCYSDGLAALNLWVRIFIGVVALFLAFGIAGYIAYPWQMEELPTNAELSAIGGHRFVRPSDGKVLEYWITGTPNAKRVVAWCHRMDGKQGADYGGDTVLQVLRESNACLVSPSCPACSGSPPYNTDSATQWLKQYTQDWIALLEHLGAEDVYVTGVSFGGQCAASLAEELKKKGMLRACAPIAGWFFNTKTDEFNKVPGAAIFASSAVMRPIFYFAWGAMVGSMADMEKTAKQQGEAGETEVKYVKQYYGKGEDLSAWNAGNVRTHKYFRQYAVQYSILGLGKEAASYINWKVFDDSSVPFVLWYGDSDSMVKAESQTMVQQKIGKHARIKSFEGSHCGFPFHDVIKGMISGRS